MSAATNPSGLPNIGRTLVSARSFDEYVLDYELQRSEGLLLRHLNSVYKVLSQTVPEGAKTGEVSERSGTSSTRLKLVVRS